MKRDLLFKVIERYLYHAAYKTDNAITRSILDKMCDVELDELWMLTQM